MIDPTSLPVNRLHPPIFPTHPTSRRVTMFLQCPECTMRNFIPNTTCSCPGPHACTCRSSIIDATSFVFVLKDLAASRDVRQWKCSHCHTEWWQQQDCNGQWLDGEFPKSIRSLGFDRVADEPNFKEWRFSKSLSGSVKNDPYR